MADVKRITPEEVVAGYRKLGFAGVAQGVYIQKRYDSVCACGMGVYAAAYLGVDLDRYFEPKNTINVYDTLMDAGFSDAYHSGFSSGFDEDDFDDSLYPSEDYAVGFADGRAAWEAMSKEAAND